MYKSEKEIKRTTIYEGLFVFEYDEYDEYPEWAQRVAPFEEATLSVGVSCPHVTIDYRPFKTHEEFYGREVFVVVKGYANDGNNEGYSVDLIPERWVYDSDDEFDNFCSLFTAEEYHLTLSVSEDGRPVDTGKLKFTALPMNRQKVLKCRFGAFVSIVYEDGTKSTEYIFRA